MAKLLLLLILSLYPSIISLSCRVSHSSAALHHPHSGVRWNRELHSPSTRWQLRGGSDDGMEGVFDVLPPSVRGLVQQLNKKGDGDADYDTDTDDDSQSHAQARQPEKRAPPQMRAPSQTSLLGSEASERSESEDQLPPMNDMREAEVLDRALKRWKSNMEERSRNPRIALMEHPKWQWMQEVEKFQNDTLLAIEKFEARLQEENTSILTHPLVLKLQELFPRNLDGALEDDDTIPEPNVWTMEEKTIAYEALADDVSVNRSVTHGPFWALSKDELNDALHNCILDGASDAQTIRDLVRSGANPTQSLAPHVMGPLHLAVHLRRHAYVDELVKLGADVNMRRAGNDDAHLAAGETPLMRAAIVGDASGVKQLVELGGRVNDCDQDGCTALHYAAGNGHIDAAAALLAAGALVSVADKRGCLALDYAVEHNETEMVIMLQSTTGSGQ